MSTIKTSYMNLAIVFYSASLLFSCGNNTTASTEAQNKAESSTINIEKETENTVIEPLTKETTTEVLEVTNEKIDKTLPKETNIKPKKEVVIKDIPDTTVITPKVKEAGTNETTSSNKEEVKKNKVITNPVSNSISHKAWNELLKKYVDNKGNVDYKSFKNDEAALQSYLDVLAKNKPTASSTKNEKLAYYINLYNAATVKLILNNYPTKSIKSIRSPWSKKWVKVGDEVLSLGNIEHKILRKMNEPRIHFAINCASYSCPKLVNKAFTAAGMENQLEQATKDFVNDTTRNQFTNDKAKLSEIFKWYKGDFTDNSSLLEYIAKYADKKVNTKSKIGYLDYDWSLNEAK